MASVTVRLPKGILIGDSDEEVEERYDACSVELQIYDDQGAEMMFTMHLAQGAEQGLPLTTLHLHAARIIRTWNGEEKKYDVAKTEDNVQIVFDLEQNKLKEQVPE